MQHGLDDTDADTARVHADLLRASSPERRLRLALSLSRTVMCLARSGLARSAPDASPEDIALAFVRHHYGAAVAVDLRAALMNRSR